MFDFTDTQTNPPKLNDSEWGQSIQVQKDESRFIACVARPKNMNNEIFFTMLLHMLRAISLGSKGTPMEFSFQSACSFKRTPTLSSIHSLNLTLAQVMTMWFATYGKQQPNILPQFLNLVFNPKTQPESQELVFGPKSIDCAHHDLLLFTNLLLMERTDAQDTKGIRALTKHVKDMEAIESPQTQEGVSTCIVCLRKALKDFAIFCLNKPAEPAAKYIQTLFNKQETLL